MIDTATHDEPSLTSVPSITSTLDDLSVAIERRCGVPSKALHRLLDPPDARSMAVPSPR
ncbi:hypothetical protein [Actinosynnema sp. ALI-1.44]|uniref:hypothetical protein n=1 Tax=Actinosynnema sp. ALI-1.44 TaxID=1933779 RepID=UPI00143DE06B|nr:hypothetical protein [Actinosynnema sp. ALI-1.44]